MAIISTTVNLPLGIEQGNTNHEQYNEIYANKTRRRAHAPAVSRVLC